MTVGERIKLKRIERGMSADELAEKLGKNRATIYRYESNEIENLPIAVLEPIAKALYTTPMYLMGWDEEQIYSLTKEQERIAALEDALENDLKSKLVKLTTEQLSTLNDILGMNLTEEEMIDLLDYARFLVSKRK